MKARCANCDSQFEVELDSPSNETKCPACGSTVDVGLETTTFVPSNAPSIAHFSLLEHLGSGKFGEVWKAKDTKLKRLVALKLPRTEEVDDKTVNLFLREAQNSAGLKHPHIVAVHDVGRDNGTAYIVSDLIQGVTLANWLANNKPTAEQTATICALIAEALHYAHQKGIVHRDLKPANVMLDEHCDPHIMDFGLAKRDTTQTTITLEGAILGTAAYMSPEQARGDAYRADRRSDVYSLGIILYEMLTGDRPFHGDMTLLLHKVVSEDPAPPRTIRPNISRDLETICLRAIAKDPAKRYADAEQMADDLRRFLGGKPILARRAGLIERGVRWVRRNKAAAASGLVAALALLALTISMLMKSDGSENPPVVAPRRTVTMTTVPPGAEMHFIPLNEETGRPQPENIVSAGTSPVRVDLNPGDYLVVAILKDHGFHEVYRRVPGDNKRLPGPFRHHHWTVGADGTVVLPQIEKIPPTAAINGSMAYFKGNPNFEIGAAELPEAPRHRRRIMPFYLDPAEVSVAGYEAALISKKWNPPAGCKIVKPPGNHPVTCLTWDQAVACAESIGKRLPTEAELEFVATAGGKRSLPRSKSGRDFPKWEYGPCGGPSYDQIVSDSGKIVYGLYSNVAEWTMSKRASYPGQTRSAGPKEVERIVRGGPVSVAQGVPDRKEWLRGPRSRWGLHPSNYRRRLGFRCARSARPRIRPEDFEVIVPLK